MSISRGVVRFVGVTRGQGVAPVHENRFCERTFALRNSSSDFLRSLMSRVTLEKPRRAPLPSRIAVITTLAQNRLPSLRTPKATTEGTQSTLVRVVMTGFDDGVRWRRYLGLTTTQWQKALGVLKMLLER